MRSIICPSAWHPRYELLVWDSWLPWEQNAILSWSGYHPAGILFLENEIYERVEPIRDRTKSSAL